MLSRALSLATVTLLIGCFTAGLVRAQAQNLEAGKSPSQIFAGTCNACHKSPRGLLKTVAPGALPAFLRQHYTTSSDMAGLLSAFLVSNGATDTRYVGTQPKAGKDAKPEAQPGGPADQIDRLGRWLRPPAPLEGAKPEAEPRETARPNTDELAPQAESGRHGRNGRRLARPGEPPDAARPAAEGQTPAQTASERGPDGRPLTAKQRLGKRGRPGGEEPPKSDAATSDAAKEEAAKSEAAKDDKASSDSAKAEGGKPEEARPSGEGSSESVRSESPKEPSGEAAALRADPAGAGSATSDAAAPPSAAQTPPPAVTASAPPVAPAGPPAPPISQ
ncbi:MAG: hypothetical protein NVSMB20_02220 [Bradyrhizobium sp.]